MAKKKEQFVSIEKYAELCDVTVKTIKWRIEEGHLKTVITELYGTKVIAIDTFMYPACRMRAKKE